MQVELRERKLGELLGLTFSLAAAHFGKLLAIAAVLGIPSLLVQIYSATSIKSATYANQPSTGGLLLFAIGIFVALVVGPIQQGASLLLISGSFTGKEYSLGDSLRVGLRKLVPLFCYSLVIGLIIVLGMLLLLVPGFIFLTWYFVGSAALIVEDSGWKDAMARSKTLSEGRRLPLLGFILIVLGILYLSIFLVAAIVGAFIDEGVAQTLLIWAVSVVFGLPLIVAPVVYYFQLRVVKEALDVQSLSSLVDAIEARARTSPPA